MTFELKNSQVLDLCSRFVAQNLLMFCPNFNPKYFWDRQRACFRNGPARCFLKLSLEFASARASHTPPPLRVSPKLSPTPFAIVPQVVPEIVRQIVSQIVPESVSKGSCRYLLIVLQIDPAYGNFLYKEIRPTFRAAFRATFRPAFRTTIRQHFGQPIRARTRATMTGKNSDNNSGQFG